MAATAEERIGVLEAGQTELRADIHKIGENVDEIRRELAGRPSWAVATIITLLSSTCCGLIVALATSVTL